MKTEEYQAIAELIAQNNKMLLEKMEQNHNEVMKKMELLSQNQIIISKNLTTVDNRVRKMSKEVDETHKGLLDFEISWNRFSSSWTNYIKASNEVNQEKFTYLHYIMDNLDSSVKSNEAQFKELSSTVRSSSYTPSRIGI